ncbi:hypothetical protein C6376_29840 [Streptomyces sp. P3]|nr:hypothetical protein C6376_29840 [Streptomyces sp. P3]
MLGEVPDSVEVRSRIPQPAVLRQADLFVTHAGAGGGREGPATPVIAVPQAVGRSGRADILREHGVARRTGPADTKAGALREAALALVGDPAVARRLRAVQAETAAEGGTPRAADLVEAEPARTRG